MGSAIIANVVIILFIGLCVWIGARYDAGFKAIGTMWVGVYWSFIGWLIFIAAHFIGKFW